METCFYCIIYSYYMLVCLHTQEEEQRLSEFTQQKNQGFSLGSIAGRFWSRKQQWGLVVVTPTRNSPTWTVTRHWEEGHSQTGGQRMWTCEREGRKASVGQKHPNIYTEWLLLRVGVGIRRAQLQKTIYSCVGDDTWTADTQIWCPNVWPHLRLQTKGFTLSSWLDRFLSSPVLALQEHRTTYNHVNRWNDTDTFPSLRS